MGERNRNVNPLFVSLGAALFVLAGSAQAVAQGTGKKASPPKSSPPPAASAPLAPPMVGNGSPKGGAGPAKVIHEAADGSKGDGKNDDKVKVDDHLIVDLHVNDEDLANVLQMLSIQAQRNIVTSKNVSAVVTANLYGVTFYEALDAILHVNGYGYVERGNFIYVYTLDELQKLEEAQKSRVWKVLKLNYLNSVDAAEFVKPLLSEGGQIKTNGKPASASGGADTPAGGEDFASDSTLVVFDYSENLGEIEKILHEMDTRPAQVLIEATILQTSLNEANAFGVDFSVIGDLSFSKFTSIGGPLRAVDALINGGGSAASASGGGSGAGAGTGTGTGTGTGSGAAASSVAISKGQAVTSTPGNTSGPATLKLGIVSNDIAAFLRLLDEVSDTQILSRPNVLCLNRQPARVLVGRKVGYLSTTSTDTSTTQTVEFLDTGTQLVVRPFVSSDGMIRMDLRPKVSEAQIRNVTNSGGAAVTIPDEISNELAANVMVRDGQTIVLGGLFRENTSQSRRQVPGIGDVPIIGAAFRGHEDSVQRNEIIFMITPTVVNDTVLLDEGKRAEAAVDRVRTGARAGLLPWSRDKRSQQLLVQATELARQGKKDQALFKIQQSLRLNHNQPDAIALREALTNGHQAIPSRSIQNEIINNEVQKSLSGGSMPAMKPLGAPPVAAGVSGDDSAAAVMTNAARSAKLKSVPVVSVSVETLEPMDSPVLEQGKSEPEKAWLPATIDGPAPAEPEAMAPEATAPESAPVPQSTTPGSTPTAAKPAAAGPATFPTPSLAEAMNAVFSELPAEPETKPAATPGAASAEPSPEATTPAVVPTGPTAEAPAPPALLAMAESVNTVPPSSFGFWGLWKLYAEYAQRQVTPATRDSAVTTVPAETDNR